MFVALTAVWVTVITPSVPGSAASLVLAMVTVAVSLSAMVLVAEPAAVMAALEVAAVRSTITVSPGSTIRSCKTGMVISAVLVLAGMTTVRGSAV